MASARSVVVVGSGPNGLAAAISLARAGWSVRVLEAGPTPGGGCRTVPMPGFPWLQRDPCAAVHPLAAASPIFRARPAEFRPTLLEPPIALAHLFGRAGALDSVAPASSTSPTSPVGRVHAASPSPTGPFRAPLLFPRNLSMLVDVNDADFPAAAWIDAIDPLATHADTVVESVLSARPSPAAVRALGQFAARMYRHLLAHPDGPIASAFAGLAVHAIAPPGRPVSFGSGALLAATLHGRGWPIPQGGSGAIVDGLLRELDSLGVTVECDSRVSALDEFDPPSVNRPSPAPGTHGSCSRPAIVLAIGAKEAARIVEASRRPRAGIAARWLAAMPSGGAAARVDFALKGPVPWRDSRVATAGTVHLTGTAREAAFAERQIARGLLPDHLPILASQPWVADPLRLDPGRNALSPDTARTSNAGHASHAAMNGSPRITPSTHSHGRADRVLWTYAHVPTGYTGSVADAVATEIERHAPGFRDVVAGVYESGPQDLERYNPSYVGGDIAAGAASLAGMTHRLTTGWGQIPGLSGVWLCGASTLPGPGVHGMSGAAVASAVNKWLSRRAEVAY